MRQRQLDAAVAAYGPEAAATFQPEPIREERQPHVVVEGLKDETAFDLRRLEDQVGAGGEGGEQQARRENKT